jgi:hypothetical protein
MADLWTQEELHRDIGGILYVFSHAALHTACEAVVEGMGGVVSQHGDKSRSCLRQFLIEAEAIIHYNFPSLAHPNAVQLIREALTDYFGEGKP